MKVSGEDPNLWFYANITPSKSVDFYDTFDITIKLTPPSSIEAAAPIINIFKINKTEIDKRVEKCSFNSIITMTLNLVHGENTEAVLGVQTSDGEMHIKNEMLPCYETVHPYTTGTSVRPSRYKDVYKIKHLFFTAAKKWDNVVDVNNVLDNLNETKTLLFDQTVQTTEELEIFTRYFFNAIQHGIDITFDAPKNQFYDFARNNVHRMELNAMDFLRLYEYRNKWVLFEFKMFTVYMAWTDLSGDFEIKVEHNTGGSSTTLIVPKKLFMQSLMALPDHVRQDNFVNIVKEEEEDTERQDKDKEEEENEDVDVEKKEMVENGEKEVEEEKRTAKEEREDNEEMEEEMDYEEENDVGNECEEKWVSDKRVCPQICKDSSFRVPSTAPWPNGGSLKHEITYALTTQALGCGVSSGRAVGYQSEVRGSNPSPGQVNFLLPLCVHPALKWVAKTLKTRREKAMESYLIMPYAKNNQDPYSLFPNAWIKRGTHFTFTLHQSRHRLNNKMTSVKLFHRPRH
ncbi:hypothetical protein PoB_005902700 [Plakobranchus ocellatus]|uniref:Uncharacterized protein n=1 Tax=Plakobranchus ocellatus TaxID=259542 RepID=A0AAV4CLU3_9GAST|nr:hypothetical protein PoB_005902700 [Plakobranchus ocellatus]